MFQERLKRIIHNIRLITNILIIVVIILLSLSLLGSIKKILNANQKLTEAKNKIEAAQKEQEELKKKVAEAKSQEFIEKEARNKLGLAKAGEIIVVLPDAQTLKLLAPTPEKEENFLPDPNWKKWAKLFF
ncbi:MAG TPA: septum formation initiator family protein [Patescibacteria group bacterium]